MLDDVRPAGLPSEKIQRAPMLFSNSGSESASPPPKPQTRRVRRRVRKGNHHPPAGPLPPPGYPTHYFSLDPPVLAPRSSPPPPHASPASLAATRKAVSPSPPPTEGVEESDSPLRVHDLDPFLFAPSPPRSDPHGQDDLYPHLLGLDRELLFRILVHLSVKDLESLALSCIPLNLFITQHATLWRVKAHGLSRILILSQGDPAAPTGPPLPFDFHLDYEYSYTGSGSGSDSGSHSGSDHGGYRYDDGYSGEEDDTSPLLARVSQLEADLVLAQSTIAHLRASKANKDAAAGADADADANTEAFSHSKEENQVELRKQVSDLETREKERDERTLALVKQLGEMRAALAESHQELAASMARTAEAERDVEALRKASAHVQQTLQARLVEQNTARLEAEDIAQTREEELVGLRAQLDAALSRAQLESEIAGERERTIESLRDLNAQLESAVLDMPNVAPPPLPPPPFLDSSEDESASASASSEDERDDLLAPGTHTLELGNVLAHVRALGAEHAELAADAQMLRLLHDDILVQTQAALLSLTSVQSGTLASLQATLDNVLSTVEEDDDDATLSETAPSTSNSSASNSEAMRAMMIVAQLEERNERLEAELDSSRNLVVKHMEHLEGQNAILATERERNADLVTQVRALEAQVTLAAEKQSSTSSELAASYSLLQEQNQSLGEQYAGVVAELETERETSTALQAQVASLEVQLAADQEAVAELDAARTRVTELDAMHGSLVDQLTSLQDQYAELVSETSVESEANAERARADEVRVLELETQVLELEAALEESKAKASEYKSKFKSKKKEMKHALKENSARDAAAAVVESTITTAAAVGAARQAAQVRAAEQVAEVKAEAAVTEAGLESRIRALRDELAMAEAMMLAVESRTREEVEAENAQAVANLRAEIFALDQDLKASEAGRDLAESREIELEKTVVTLREEVAMMHKELIVLTDGSEAKDNAVVSLETQLRASSSELGSREDQLAEASNLLDQMRAQVVKTSKTNSALATRVHQLEEEVQSLQAALVNADAAANSAASSAATLEPRVADLQAELASAVAARDAAAEEAAAAKASLGTRMKQLAETRSKFVRLSKAKAEADAAAESAREVQATREAAVTAERDRLASAAVESARTMASLRARVETLEASLSGSPARAVSVDRIRAEASAREAAEAELDATRRELADAHRVQHSVAELQSQLAAREAELAQARSALRAARSQQSMRSPLRKPVLDDGHESGISVLDERNLLITHCEDPDELVDVRLADLGWSRSQLAVVKTFVLDRPFSNPNQ